jgi:hypothetical protein
MGCGVHRAPARRGRPQVPPYRARRRPETRSPQGSDRSELLTDTLFDMGNTKMAGNASEAVVMAEFLKAGFPVLIPFGENSRYDLVVEADGRFLPVQCKTASRCGWRATGRACASIRAASASKPQRGNREPVLSGPGGPVRCVLAGHQAGVCPRRGRGARDRCLAAPGAPRNNNQYGIRLAEDHTLAAWAARQGAVHSQGPA